MSLSVVKSYYPSCVFSWKGSSIAVSLLASYVIYTKLFKKRAAPKLHRADWKKGVVYLFQFHRPNYMPSLSPFCVKLEMFLRMNNIPYENIFVSSTRSKYGLVPFIELDGQHYADSQLIIEKLKEYFNVKPLPNPRDEAFARSLERMTEHHSFPILIKYRIFDNLNGFVTAVLKTFKFSPFSISLLIPLLRNTFRKKIGARIHTMIGPFSEAEFHGLLKKDLDCMRDALGDRKYLMGDEPSAVDCAVFAHLATVCYMEESNEVMRLVAAEYPTLQAYQERIKDRFFASEFGFK